MATNFSFCPNCGQEVILSHNLSLLIHNFLSDYFTFDSKIFRSYLPLLTKPGFLSLEYLRGKRVKYVPPLRMFIFLSIIFFLILGVFNSDVETTGKTDGLNEYFWNHFFDSWLPKLFFVLLPIFALLIALLFRKLKQTYLLHFLFALHFHSTLFLSGIIYASISWVLTKLNLQFVNLWLLILVGAYLAVYLWKALINVYKESRKRTTWKFFVLSISYILLLIIFSALLLLAYSVNF